MRKGNIKKKKEVKRRKSYITIAIVVLFISLAAIICIRYSIKHSKVVEKIVASEYYSNLREEDGMKYEYAKINDELNNLCAFAISQGYVVGVDESGKLVNIIQINANNTYDYTYYAQKLYLLEKESGIVSIIPLKTESGSNYEISDSINLERRVDYIQIYEKELYYLADGTLYKYSDGEDEIIFENITGDSFIIKLNYLYALRNDELVKYKLDTKEELVLSKNVLYFNYYDYYEKNKLVFETSLDGQNIFKNILNVYSNEINNSIRNNEYFVVYGADEYIYINNDKTKLYLVDKNGNNKVVYNSKNNIEDVVFIKDGHAIVKAEDEVISLNIHDKNEYEKIDTIIDNIKYIK